jgi:cytochrome c oxidase assembly protein subunit 15
MHTTRAVASHRGPSPQPVAAWLFVCCAMIFAMVVIGGITRLTESGLSITEWRPLLGALPPLSAAEWQATFDKYQQTPQYRLLNLGMTLGEFKAIFWWEYVHRLWGRLIGAVYLVPFLWFVATGRARGPLVWRLAGVFALGALQGLLGWYMVQSGLVDRVDVSPYRLAAHLGLAIVIYAASLRIALDLARPAEFVPAAIAGALARRLHLLAGLIFLTMLSGAFVAGLDAGMTYNTFPLMDGRLVPAGYLDLSPWWLNAFENVAAVQFHHRLLGISSLLASLAVWLTAPRATLPPAVGRWLAAMAGTALAQASLGIATLLLVVPIPLAAAHQAGAMILFTLALLAAHEARRGRATETAKAKAAATTTVGPDGVSRTSEA